MNERWKIRPPMPGDDVENGEPVYLIKRHDNAGWERFTGVIKGLKTPLLHEQDVIVVTEERPDPAPGQSALMHRVKT